MKNDVVDKVLIGLIVVLALVAIVSLILKLTNHSPADISILYSLVTVMIISSFKVHYDLGKLSEFSINTKSSFQLMREESQQIKLDLTEIKTILIEKRRGNKG